MISLRDVVTCFGNRDPLAEVWRRNLRGGGGGAAEITGFPPLRYIGDGRPLTDYLISGNTLQDGTPSPEAPVDVVGCGTDTASGYKLPPTVNGTEYPIYLGQVETTRRVKKLVLTGEERLTISSISLRVPIGAYIPCIAGYVRGVINTHFIANDTSETTPTYANSYTTRLGAAGGVTWFFIPRNFFSGELSVENCIAEFKAWLAAQYAAGTPVTVWYVLETPETAVVNEPLMKIGDYADTVSFAQAGVTIPTVNGENVLDVPTEVKPSEITIKGGISSV